MARSPESLPIGEDPRLSETEAILDALPHPTFAINSGYTVVRMNHAALIHSKQTHYTDTIGQPCHLMLHNREKICPFCPEKSEFEDAKDDKGRSFLEKIIQEQSPERGERTYRLNFYYYGENENISLVETIEDITLQQEKQEEAIRRENLAALGTMISGIAHELNNPLTGMGLTLQNLMANISTMESSEIQKRLNLLYKDLKRASRIVSDILSFARPGELRLTQADLKQTLQRARASIVRLYPVLSRRIDWIFDGEESVMMEYHPEKMERLFFNLFRNSLQAFDYKEGYIRVDMRKAKKNLHIVIEDNAGGIAPEQIQKIFHPFFSNSRSGSGNGLGLSICDSIVKEHRGRIRARSYGGKTFFHISLPLFRIHS